jgi:hypothetical protein
VSKKIKICKNQQLSGGESQKIPKNLAPGETFSLPGAVMDYLNN